MLPELINIVIEQGVDYTKVFEKTEPDGSVFDFTGWSNIDGDIRKHPDAVKVYPFNVGIVSTAGEISVSIAASITDSIPWGRYYYNIFGNDPFGNLQKIYKGEAFINFSL